MLQRILFLVSFATCLLIASTTSADDKPTPADMIGKRFKLIMKSKQEYRGIITQINQQSVVLTDVSQIGSTKRDVPFLSNQPYIDRLFTNVGLESEKKLDYGIVVPLNEIETWEPVASEETNNAAKEQAVDQQQIDRWSRKARLDRIDQWLSQDRDFSEDERRAIVNELDLLRKSIVKE